MTRRRLLTIAASAVALAGIVIGSVVSAPTAPKGKETSEAMVLIGTGGLAWSDISARTTPTLWSLLRDGATATLTVRSVHASTCPVDGWLTLSAGEQAADALEGGANGPGADGAKPPCRALPAEMIPGKVPHWSEYRAAAGDSKFDPSLGLLGEQVASHGGCIQAVGPGAALGSARASGMVVRYEKYDASTLPAALTTCPVTLVDVGQVRDPAEVSPQDELHPTTSRAQQVAEIDARVAEVLKVTPAGTDVIVASLADAGASERLRMIAVTGPHFGAGTLGSSSTRQPGLVQLTDLAPSILQHLGIPRPSRLGGTPITFVPAGESSDQSASKRLRALLDQDQSSHAVKSLVAPFFYGWALLQLALYLTAALLWGRGWGSGAQRHQLLLNTRRLATIAATVPVSTFLANLLPWWHFSLPMISVIASVALFAAMISALALLGPWHQRTFGPLVVVCVTTMAVLALDVMSGSRLQLSSLMGLQPVIGGRFYGMGNVTFALFATATLMLCLAVGDHLVALGQRRDAAAAVAAIGMGAVIIDAASAWGSDLGGPTALLPAVLVLVVAILQIKLTWRVMLAIGGGVTAFVTLLSLLDWLRPAEARSHLGRFVQTAIDGGAWDIIARKLVQNATLFFSNPLSLLIPIVLILFTYALARPSWWAAAPLRQPFARIPLLRPGLIAIMVMWTIGFVLNDTGAAIPAVGATLACPLVIAITIRTFDDEWEARPVLTRASRHRR
ncbi:MAG TPA: hypothetical protein VIJ15_10355 [Dermatophilaceae bacterium]